MLERVYRNCKDLDINELTENGEFTRRALMTGSKSGLTALEKGFFTFYLKDINSNLIVGRKFDVKNFIEAGFDVAALKNKLVDIDFKAQIFNGNWSLVIDSISIADDQQGLEKFIGKVDVTGVNYVEQLYTNLLGKPYKFPVVYLTESIPSICQGRSGGIGLLYVIVSRALSNYVNFPSINAQTLFSIFEAVFWKYYTYLKMKNELDVITNSAILEQVTIIKNQFNNNTELAVDCTASLLGLTQPQHIYSHIICKEVENAVRNIDMIYLNNSLPLGGNTYYKGVSLLRY